MMSENFKTNDIVRNKNTGRIAQVLRYSWIYMRGQPTGIYKLKYKDDGSMFTLNERHFKHWEIYGEEE